MEGQALHVTELVTLAMGAVNARLAIHVMGEGSALPVTPVTAGASVRRATPVTEEVNVRLVTLVTATENVRLVIRVTERAVPLGRYAKLASEPERLRFWLRSTTVSTTSENASILNSAVHPLHPERLRLPQFRMF